MILDAHDVAIVVLVALVAAGMLESARRLIRGRWRPVAPTCDRCRTALATSEPGQLASATCPECGASGAGFDSWATSRSSIARWLVAIPIAGAAFALLLQLATAGLYEGRWAPRAARFPSVAWLEHRDASNWLDEAWTSDVWGGSGFGDGPWWSDLPPLMDEALAGDDDAAWSVAHPTSRDLDEAGRIEARKAADKLLSLVDQVEPKPMQSLGWATDLAGKLCAHDVISEDESRRVINWSARHARIVPQRARASEPLGLAESSYALWRLKAAHWEATGDDADGEGKGAMAPSSPGVRSCDLDLVASVTEYLSDDILGPTTTLGTIRITRDIEIVAPDAPLVVPTRREDLRPRTTVSKVYATKLGRRWLLELPDIETRLAGVALFGTWTAEADGQRVPLSVVSEVVDDYRRSISLAGLVEPSPTDAEGRPSAHWSIRFEPGPPPAEFDPADDAEFDWIWNAPFSIEVEVTTFRRR